MARIFSSHPLPTVLLLLSFCCFVGERGDAQDTPVAPVKGDKLITNVWVDTPLSQVLRDVSMQAKATIALDPSVKDSVLSMEAEGLSLEDCLNKVAAGQGLVIRKINEGFYIVGSGQPGSPTFGQMAESHLVCLKYVTAEHLLGIIPRDLLPYVTRGKRSTEVFFYAPPELLGRIMSIARQIDVPRQQVVLEALVVEINKTKGSELSIDWERAGSQTILSMTNGADIITGFARHTTIPEQEFRTFMLTLNMLVSNGKASIRSRPRVATLNGEQAIIDMSLEEYFTIVTDISGAFLRTELQVVKSGVLLKMTPLIGNDGDVTVDVATEVSDVAAQPNKMKQGNGNSGGDLPVIRRRKAETKVQVKSGDAIVIGGLIESQEREDVRRMPILGAIPVLGILFRKTVKSAAEKEVVIFITPRLMEAGTVAAAKGHQILDLEKERAKLGLESPASALGGKGKCGQ